MSNDVWWDNVKFRDFCSHFINMTPEEIAADIKESLVKLIQLDDSGDSFGAMMVKNAKLRQGSPKSEASRQNGIKGGRPKKSEKPKQPEENSPKPEASRRHGTKPFGKFGNVFITDDEYAELGLAVGNQNELNAIIDTFGASLEDGSRTSTNHYATLTKWVQYRKDKEREKEERQNANNETYAEREGKRCRKILEQFGMIK